MSTRNLTKAQETELSNKLNKIKKRRLEVPKEVIEDNDES